MIKNFSDAYKFFISNTDKKISEKEFKKILIENLNKISDESLEDVSGGISGKNITSTLLVALSMMLPSVSTGYASSFELSNSNSDVTSYNVDEKKDDIVKYFTESKISAAQEEVFKITNEYFKKYPNKHSHISAMPEISSYRYPNFTFDPPTKIEKILDKAVQEGDLPIQSFSIEEINSIKQKYTPSSDVHPVYVFESGGDVLNLHKTAKDEAIVQVASQYNALESVNSNFSPVLNWFWDKTQGPMASFRQNFKYKKARDV